MNFSPTNKLDIYYSRRKEKLLVGTLLMQSRKILFEYSPDFLETGLDLSPFKLPLKRGVHECKEPLFEGLFGLFNDSLPDGWGRLLIDRKLASIGINPMQLSPLDRLSFVGKDGMGALTYEPEKTPPLNSIHKKLDDLAKEAELYQQNEDEQYLDDLLYANGSSAGARPKALLSIDNKNWVIKFRSSIDPIDIGPIEWAYHKMAQKAGLSLPEAKLFPSKQCGGFFGTVRFDKKNGERIHMHTLSGLIHADHRFPSLDYSAVMNATSLLTKDTKESEKQLRAIAFNILSHNRDDHAKNFSFLMDDEGQWQVSPAYDLTFSSGPAGEHCTMIMGEGRSPNKTHLIKLANKHGIQAQKGKEIIEEVQEAIASWKTIAKNSHVSQSSTAMIHKALGAIYNESS